MVLKAGWLSRQFDHVSKNVNDWPDWMKRAAGLDEKPSVASQVRPETQPDTHRAKPVVGQQKLGL